MLRVHCPDHGHDVLLGVRSIEAVVNTEAGVEVRWRCHCGRRGVLLTGVGAGAPPAPVEPAPPGGPVPLGGGDDAAEADERAVVA